MSTDRLYWHFLKADRRMRFGDRELVEVGKTLRYDGDLELCVSGFHASERAIDALGYAPGPIICRVTLGGDILEGDDKVVAQERTVLWMADATNTLHEFACRCAETALRAAKVEDRRSWDAIEIKRRWLKGEATDEQLAAARDAACKAACEARGAARGAAWAASWEAAREAARMAAWATGAATQAAQNQQLHDMLLELQPAGAAQ